MNIISKVVQSNDWADVPTFNLGQLRVQCEIDLRRAYAHQLVFVALNISEVSDELFEEVVGIGAHEVDFRGHKLVNGENIGHFNV